MDALSGIDPAVVEKFHNRWKLDPYSVDPEWSAFFSGFDLGYDNNLPDFDSDTCKNCINDEWKVLNLIDAYRRYGHLAACTDPLSPCPLGHPLLNLSKFTLKDEEKTKSFLIPEFRPEKLTLNEIINILKKAYCSSIGVEFMHIQDDEKRNFIKSRIEKLENAAAKDNAFKMHLAQTLMKAAFFESFLHKKFVGQKRFSLEGGETLIPLVETLISGLAANGAEEIVFGMPHRGRLNFLANIMQKPLQNIFSEFADNVVSGVVGEGDVKYHKGFSSDVMLNGKRIHLTLAFNPSHLELVSPVVEGKCRARQEGYPDSGRLKCVPIVMHGDAAFTGQGSVSETFNLSRLEGYTTGGTIHIIVNNQIGFTTIPKDARSTYYSTDSAKGFGLPVLHVHGDDPEAAIKAAEIALQYRQKFNDDILIEIVCYRKHGHNEGDEPYFTQPVMYSLIKDRPSVYALYKKRLLDEGGEASLFETLENAYSRLLTESAGKSGDVSIEAGFNDKWKVVEKSFSFTPVETSVATLKLLEIATLLWGKKSGKFNLHPKISKILEKRVDSVKSGKNIDWGCAESLAFATLLDEGISVRLSGQDARRGTFSHRHAVLYDQGDNSAFIPLQSAAKKGGSFNVFDSMLSELAVLAFEYGYSIASPQPLVIWEAQFGDFANGAQPIIDQFISSGESKWDRSSGVVLLLPHGYEGQGAEHSSARIERYLQLSAEDNIIVTNPSTPAQIFHLLRRQAIQGFRKPLIIFSPKSLFRHPQCVSTLEDFSSAGFMEIISDKSLTSDKVERIILCSGKFYYDILDARDKSSDFSSAVIRVEQLYPFNKDIMLKTLSRFKNAKRLVWAQEEPRNMGGWSYIRDTLETLFNIHVDYAGRKSAAAPAVGSHRVHAIEQQEILNSLFETAR